MSASLLACRVPAVTEETGDSDHAGGFGSEEINNLRVYVRTTVCSYVASCFGMRAKRVKVCTHSFQEVA